MRFPAALILTSIALFGQSAPPEVDQALRARVDEFFSYHVSGKFMKALPLVAEDTKEYYFAAQKNLYVSYEVGKVEYSDNFTQATVTVTGKRKVRPRPEFPEIVVDHVMPTTWKLENGQWVWYVNTVVKCPTPMSCGSDGKPKAEAQQANANNVSKMPDVSPSAIDQQAQKIRGQSRVDKPAIAMASKMATTEHVVFHNGQPGYVRVFLDQGTEVEGLTATLDKTDVKAYEDVTITLEYKPGSTPPPLAVTMKLLVQPLGQTFPITVKFAK
jgi:hypothetical protein